MKQPERALQIDVAKYLKLALRSPSYFSAIGHGGGGKIRGAILKTMGMKPGLPDIIVLHPVLQRGNNAGCWVIGIELKSATGGLTPAQKATKVAFEEAGGFYYVARSVIEVGGFLQGLGVPLYEDAVTFSARKAA